MASRKLICLLGLFGVFVGQAQTTITLSFTIAGPELAALEQARMQLESGRYSLADAISAQTTTILLADATGMPAAGQIMIDSEALTFSYSGAGNSITVVRGASITTAAAHAAASRIRLLQFPTLAALARDAAIARLKMLLIQTPSPAIQTLLDQLNAAKAALSAAAANAIQ